MSCSRRFASTAECWIQCLSEWTSSLHTWKGTKVPSFVCMCCCCCCCLFFYYFEPIHPLWQNHSGWMGSKSLVVYVCVCVTVRGGLDQKATVFNMSNKCSLCECLSVLDYMLAWLHCEYFCPLTHITLHHFVCLSACILPILASPSVVKKMLSTHNRRGRCQVLCLLCTFCLTAQAFFKMVADCGTISAGFKG